MSLSVEAPGTLAAHGNRELIGQALANLVDNALKYAKPCEPGGEKPAPFEIQVSAQSQWRRACRGLGRRSRPRHPGRRSRARARALRAPRDEPHPAGLRPRLEPRQCGDAPAWGLAEARGQPSGLARHLVAAAGPARARRHERRGHARRARGRPRRGRCSPRGSSRRRARRAGATGGLRAFLDGVEDEGLRARAREPSPRQGACARRLVEAVLGHSPFLARIVTSRPDWLARGARRGAAAPSRPAARGHARRLRLGKERCGDHAGAAPGAPARRAPRRARRSRRRLDARRGHRGVDAARRRRRRRSPPTMCCATLTAPASSCCRSPSIRAGARASS